MTTPTTDGNKAQGDKNPSNVTAGAASSSDVQAAESAGITEGEFKALRDDAGVNQSAGSEAHVKAWEASAAGKEFVKAEGDRQKAIKDEAKTIDEQTNKDGLDEGAAKYVEVTSK